MNIEVTNWEWGTNFAEELLEAIKILATTKMKRVDSDSFKAYWAGDTLRIDIPRSELA